MRVQVGPLAYDALHSTIMAFAQAGGHRLLSELESACPCCLHHMTPDGPADLHPACTQACTQARTRWLRLTDAL